MVKESIYHPGDWLDERSYILMRLPQFSFIAEDFCIYLARRIAKLEFHESVPRTTMMDLVNFHGTVQGFENLKNDFLAHAEEAIKLLQSGAPKGCWIGWNGERFGMWKEEEASVPG